MARRKQALKDLTGIRQRGGTHLVAQSRVPRPSFRLPLIVQAAMERPLRSATRWPLAGPVCSIAVSEAPGERPQSQMSR
jgi:hypothetical protein